MAPALVPPIEPMLARLVRDLPSDGFVYEPKWDGFRALSFRDGATVDLRSRNQRPLARYFPEIGDALVRVPCSRFVLDGEIVVAGRRGGLDFAGLMSRLHPAASRVARLRAEAPALYIAFDLLAAGDEVLLERPFEERRGRLEALLRGSEGHELALTPATDDRETAARWLHEFTGGGVDGVVAKPRAGPYVPGRRQMLKVKLARTAECVVAGLRWQWDRPMVGALLLGLFDGRVLRHVGVASSFSASLRAELLEKLGPLVTPLEGHPWEHGFGLDRSPVGRLAGAAGRWAPDEMEMDWVPLRPDLVCEVAYDTLDGFRFRYPARFLRWRPDRDPASCTFEQLDDSPPDVAALLGSS